MWVWALAPLVFINNTLYHNEFALDKYAECIVERKSAVVKERTFDVNSRMYYRLMVDLFNGKLSKKKISNHVWHQNRRCP
ncbi:MAG: hypothetical protein LRY68_04905 [Sulfurospirillum sp.]|nr:hypothetical protein [Sulfurospirillum sp.]